MHFTVNDKIFDSETKKEVIWRGVGGSYIFHAGEGYKTAWEQRLPTIKAMGLNTFRLAFAFEDSSPNPEAGRPSADILDFDKMDWVLDFLAQNGIKGILDLHNYKDMYGDFGSEKLVNDWRRVADHYRGDERVAAYELFNEPFSATWAPSIKSKRDVAVFYANLTDAIREIDPDHIVIWESQPYVPPLNEIADLFRPNLVFTLHRWWHRTDFEFKVWSVEQLSYVSVAPMVEYRGRLNIPFWLGEFGAYRPFDYSNPEWSLTEQQIWRCEEQVIGWNLWLGHTPIEEYLDFFPLKVYNSNLVRKSWVVPMPNLLNYVVDENHVDSLEPYRIEMWHNNDYVTLKPGIIVRFVRNHRLPDGTVEVVEDQTIKVTSTKTFTNIEGTPEYPGDWNMKIYSIGFMPPTVLTGPLGIWSFPVVTWLGSLFPTVRSKAEVILTDIKNRWRTSVS